MKLALFNLLLVAVNLPLAAQTLYVPSGSGGIGSSGNGNVGIGITSPQSKFHLHAASNPALQITDDTSGAASATNGLYLQQAGLASYIWNYEAGDMYLGVDGTTKLTIKSGGNVGVGTTSPNAKLEVAGYQRINASISGSLLDVMNADGNDGSGLYVKAGGVNSGRYALAIQNAAGTDVMRVLASGNVGIGTTSPSHKLAVNGIIRAKEVIVNTGWSDYVFDESYKLKALSEVEAYVKAEKHLPGIPSAKEVAGHGVTLGEMQSRLLAKIEELTLHQIQQEKEISALKSEVIQLRKNSSR